MIIFFPSGEKLPLFPHCLVYGVVLYQDKLGFNLRLGLTCTSSWVHHPEFLDLMYTDRIFLISVDPTGAVEIVFLRV